MKLGVPASLGRVWLLAALLQAGAGHAQVSTNVTGSGLGTSVTPQAGGVYDITGGTRPANGPNLFHSFGTFNVGSGDVANFRNDSLAATSNIIGRVTGEIPTPAAASNIFGTIRTTDFGNANLFLINPAGWVFGAGAALEVGGSFHASTADYIRFSDGAQFFANPASASVLSSAPPTAFGFLGGTPTSIVVDSTFLQVPDGQTLSLVAGDIQVSGSTLAAASGRIQIGSFASAGEATVDGLNGAFSTLGNIQISASTLSGVDISSLGGGTVLLRGDQININSGSLIDTSGDFFSSPGGPILIRGGQLVVDSSTITSSSFGDTDGGTIDFSLTRGIEFSNLTNIGTIASADFGIGLGRGGNIQLAAPQISINGAIVLSQTFGEGAAGNVSLQGATVELINGGTVGSQTIANGRGGDVSVSATQSVLVSGHDARETPSSIGTFTQGFGDAGRLTLSSPSLALSDGGAILSTTFGGLGGPIEVAVDRLSLTGGGNIHTQTVSDKEGGKIEIRARESVDLTGAGSGIFSDSSLVSVGRPGDITLTTGALSVKLGAFIRSGSRTDPGGGSLSLSVSGPITISDGSDVSTSAGDQPIGPLTISGASLTVDNAYVSASTLGARGGDVSMNVGTLTLTRGGQVSSNADIQASDRGGNVTVNANSVSISGTSPTGVPSTPFNANPHSGIFSSTSSSKNANAGQVIINTPVLTMADGGTISVATSAGGAAGSIALNVGTLSMASSATINSSTSAGGAGGAITLAAPNASISGTGTGLFSTASNAGNAGEINLSGGNATVADGGRVSAATTAAGNAGTITANVGSMTVSGGQVDSSTSARGAGGTINMTAGSEVSVLNGGRVSADSTGAGNTGNIVITAGNRITMAGGSISTRALTSDGGNITLRAPLLVRLEGSQITTSVQSGVGAGGNVLIDPQFVLINNSTISANAFGGPGGNITIIGDNFLASPSALLVASSALSTPGRIAIRSPENNLAGSIAQLPRAFVDASRLLRGACSARREGAPSSFTLAGRGGVPPEADGYLPSSIVAAPAAPLALAFAPLDDCAR